MDIDITRPESAEKENVTLSFKVPATPDGLECLGWALVGVGILAIAASQIFSQP